MTKPNFTAMTRKELLSYILEHRDEEESLRVLIDRAMAAPHEIHPAPQSIDDLQHFPELLEKHLQQQQE